MHREPYRVTTDSARAHPVAANLFDRRFDGWAPDRARVADITYVSTAQGWLYPACVPDLGTRAPVGGSMSDRLRASLVCDALKTAYWRRKPAAGLPMHSDRGGQCASREYRALIRSYRVLQSMSRKANCWDNAAIESFFRSLKAERVDHVRYASRRQARTDTVDWIEDFYKRRRLQRAIGCRTSLQIEQQLIAA